MLACFLYGGFGCSQPRNARYTKERYQSARSNVKLLAAIMNTSVNGGRWMNGWSGHCHEDESLSLRARGARSNGGQTQLWRSARPAARPRPAEAAVVAESDHRQRAGKLTGGRYAGRGLRSQRLQRPGAHSLHVPASQLLDNKLRERERGEGEKPRSTVAEGSNFQCRVMQGVDVYQKLSARSLNVFCLWYWVWESIKFTTPLNKEVQLSLIARAMLTHCFCFYRAMHFSAKRGIAIACRLSVRLWRWWIVIT